MEQIERIKQMELRLDRASSALMDLSAALEKYNEAQDDISQLDAYYTSDEWKQDFAADEAGELPPSLRRGVLSEDAVYDQITAVRDASFRMLALATDILKNRI